MHSVSFRARLWKYPGKGGWHFVTLPNAKSPPATHGWGRTPVTATVDGYRWKTSVWKSKDGRSVLAVPKVARGDKKGGSIVKVNLEFSL